ncbi:MAG: hypothetical protein ABIP29_09395 [Candidatus Eisenbacteria bacterium]
MAGRDSTRLFVTVGAGADLSNQLFYEQSFDSTAFSERITVSDPETRVGILGHVRLVGLRGRTSFQVENEARAGDALLRSLVRAGVAHATGEHARLTLDVEADGRHDTSFGVRRRDLRLGALAAGRLSTADRLASARLFVRGERVRGSEGADDGLRLFPDFDFVQAGLDADRLWGSRGTASLGYALGARSFPDTSARNYLEHTLGLSGLWRIDDRWSFDVFGDGGRRAARRDSAVGDRLWQGDLEGRLTRRAGERWELGLRSRVRGLRYDAPTTTYFDSRFWRHAAFARLRTDSGLEVEIRPEIEFARTPDFGRLPASASAGDRRAVAGEEYDELVLRGEVERFGAGGWWTVSPAVGRRNYLKAAAAAEDLSSRSDFWFAEVTAFADRRLRRGLELRASVDLRMERHEIAADDAKSLSVAAELRVPLM